MAQKIIAGNWKMNKSLSEADALVSDLLSEMDNVPEGVQLIICPPALFVQSTVSQCTGTALHVGAQNCATADSGAFTGEISASMLSSVNAQYCIVGHSERRTIYHESDIDIKQKVNQLLAAGIKPIFCCGESLIQREGGSHFDVVSRQIEEALFHLSAEQMGSVVVAYEPVWAIGTGVTASPEQAQEMHAHIRSLLRDRFGESTASQTSILYGGSCKPSNAVELFSQQDIDGGLIGGAALNADDFLAIAQS